MGYDEDSNEDNKKDSNEDNKQDNAKDTKPKTFFGLEMGDGVVYTVVVILTLIFIRQMFIVFQALN